MKKKIYYVSGGPASGKGTRCRILSEELGIPHISTGDMLREKAETDVELNKQISNGYLASDDLVLQLLIDRTSKDDCKNGYILDGCPRNLNQAVIVVDNTGDEFDIICIELEIPDGVALDRILGRKRCDKCKDIVNVELNKIICDKCGGNLITRTDDTPETLLKRIETYKSNQNEISAFLLSKGYKYSYLNSENNPEKILEYI